MSTPTPLYQYLIVQKKHQEQLSSDMPPRDFVKQYLFHRACIAVYGIDVGDVAIWVRDDVGGWVGLHGTRQEYSLSPQPDDEINEPKIKRGSRRRKEADHGRPPKYEHIALAREKAMRKQNGSTLTKK